MIKIKIKYGRFILWRKGRRRRRGIQRIKYGRFILWIPLLLLRPFLPHFPHLSLRLRFVTANNRYLPGYLGQHMPSSERLGADEHQMKIYRYNFELWLTGPIVMRMRGYPEFEVDSLAIK